MAQQSSLKATRDRATILLPDGALAATAALGWERSEFGVSSSLGEVLTNGSQFYQSNASVAGLAQSSGRIEKQYGVQLGSDVSFKPIDLASIAWLVGWTTSDLSIFALGGDVLFESPIYGVSLMAPNSHVTVTTAASESRFGLLVGGVVEVQPDVRLWCDRASSIQKK